MCDGGIGGVEVGERVCGGGRREGVVEVGGCV